MNQHSLFKRLKQNDITLQRLRISTNVDNGESFFPRKNKTWTDLGNHLGQNKTVTTLSFSFPDTTSAYQSALWLDCLAHGLRNNKSIRLLSFRNVHFSRRGSFFMKMARFWRNNRFLYCIRFNFCDVDEREWYTLARAITLSSSLKNIIIRNTRLSLNNLLAISPALRGGLDLVRLCQCEMDDRHMNILSDLWVMDNMAPYIVDFSGNRSITAASCQPMSRVIKSAGSFSLSNTSIGDNGLVALFQTYHEFPYQYHHKMVPNLQTLNLEASNLTDAACRTLRMLLQGQVYAITNLNLNRNNISNKGLAHLVTGLKGNTSLNTLHLAENGITPKGWPVFLGLICDVTTIDATNQSNHTLATLTGPTDDFWKSIIGTNIKAMLFINAQAARKRQNPPLARKVAAATKITDRHLVNLYKSSSTILDCNDDNLFPLIIAWIGNHYGSVMNWADAKVALTALNHLIHHKCNLFQSHVSLVVPSPKRERPEEKRRKRTEILRAKRAQRTAVEKKAEDYECYANRPIKRAARDTFSVQNHTSTYLSGERASKP